MLLRKTFVTLIILVITYEVIELLNPNPLGGAYVHVMAVVNKVEDDIISQPFPLRQLIGWS